MRNSEVVDRDIKRRPLQDSVGDTLLLTEHQPLTMMSQDAATVHCYFAYDFNAAMISNSIRTVHSVPGGHGKIQWVILLGSTTESCDPFPVAVSF